VLAAAAVGAATCTLQGMYAPHNHHYSEEGALLQGLSPAARPRDSRPARRRAEPSMDTRGAVIRKHTNCPTLVFKNFKGPA